MCWHYGCGKGVFREHRGGTTMRVEESIEINRPLQEVFDYVSDVGNYPEWMADALEVRKDTAGSPHQSDRFIVAIKSVGRRFETPYERTSYEAHRRYTDRAVGGPVPNQRWDSTVEEVPGGTRLRRAVDAEGGWLAQGVGTAPEAVSRARTFKTLKDLLEAR